MAEIRQETEYITEEEARAVGKLFQKNLQSYKKKDVSVTDEEWLAEMFRRELPAGISPEETKHEAGKIAEEIQTYHENLVSINEAAENGISKERWLADKMQKASADMTANEFGNTLQSWDDILSKKNAELSEALRRSADGNIKMSPNLDGNIAENMIANTAEMSGALQGKNIKVEVRDVFTANSVDVRATNLDTGEYQNYQLKFGKDAKATIKLIERGNYNNQRIVVPKEQLEEVQAYFRAKGSQKTITDHIEAYGAVGKSYSKEDMKNIQTAAQKGNMPPEMDYNDFRLRDLTMSVAKNAGVMALQSMAVTTGFNIAKKVFKGEVMDADELVESAVETGMDTSVKVVAAGTLDVAVKKEVVRCIPKTTPAGVIANIACAGVENVKILSKVASGELSLPQGIDHLGRANVSMAGGFMGMAKGSALGATAGVALAACVPVVGPALGVATGLVGGMVGYLGGSKVGEAVYNTAKTVAKTAWEGVKAVGRGIANVATGIKDFLFGWL